MDESILNSNDEFYATIKQAIISICCLQILGAGIILGFLRDDIIFGLVITPLGILGSIICIYDFIIKPRRVKNNVQ